MATKRLVLALLLLAILFAAAQTVVAQQVFIQSSKSGEQLWLPGVLHKPSGDGPFPAVVMLSGCGGYAAGNDAAQASFWIDKFVGWGYVALQLDSFSPRGFPKGVCDNPFTEVTADMRSQDAYSGKAYLSTLPFVDSKNIAVIGWSHGGIAVIRIIDRNSRSTEISPFKAAVAFYPYCWPLVDPDTPTLVLIGRKDDWCPAALAESLGKEWKDWNFKPEYSLTIYPNATHVFDQATLPATGVTFLGHHFQYDPEATADAVNRTRDFLAKYIGGTKTSQRESIGTLAVAATSSSPSVRPGQQVQDVNGTTSPCGCSAQ
jgi:dienelactone hydrolase